MSNVLLKILLSIVIDGTHDHTNIFILWRQQWQIEYWFNAVSYFWFDVLMSSFWNSSACFVSPCPLMYAILRSWLLFRISQLSKVLSVCSWLVVRQIIHCQLTLLGFGCSIFRTASRISVLTSIRDMSSVMAWIDLLYGTYGLDFLYGV